MAERQNTDILRISNEDINNILEFVYRLASVKKSYTRYVQGVLQLLSRYFDEKNMIFFYKHATIYPTLSGEGILYTNNEEAGDVVRYLEDFSLNLAQKSTERVL